MVNYSSLIIMLAIAFTVLNLGTMLFLKRNAIETYVMPIKRKIGSDIEKIKPLEVLREKEISASKETEPSVKIGNYCAYCGLKVEPDHKFCRSCGKPLD